MLTAQPASCSCAARLQQRRQSARSSSSPRQQQQQPRRGGSAAVAAATSGGGASAERQRRAAAVQQQQRQQGLWRAGSVVDSPGSFMTATESSSDTEWEPMHEARAAAADAGVKLQPSPEVVQLLRSADAFTFDVDSTFCADESIDEIAAFLGVGDQVAELTKQAMGGTVLFQEALAARLGVMHPSRYDLERFLEGHPPKISPGIAELVSLLKSQGKEVFLVSGGFRIVIHPIAESLGIPLEHVFANTILFDHDGGYDGFDPAEFPSRSGGKAEAVQHIKKTHGYQTVVMVGDGMTDFEARAPGGADAFIGYGGVVYRENVALLSDWYVFRIPEITAALKGE